MINKKIKTLAFSLTFVLSTAASAMVKIEIQKETPYPSVTSDGGDISFTRTIINPENESFDLKTYDYLILPDKNIYALHTTDNTSIDENGTLTQTDAFINVPALLPTGTYEYVYSVYNKSTGEITSESFSFRKRMNEYTYPSCNEILQNGRSVGDGIYTIDPDGESGQAPEFSAYCDMTHQGGGWTLFAYNDGDAHPDWSTFMKEKTDMIGDEDGVLERSRWVNLRNTMTDGMMFIDEKKNVSRMSLSKIQRSCRPISSRAALNFGSYPEPDTNSIIQLFVNKCKFDRENYMTKIWIGPFPALEQGLVKFDVWPYANPRLTHIKQLSLFLR